jgi:hypothetical protein
MDNRSQLDWSSRQSGSGAGPSGLTGRSTARWVVSLPLLLAGSLMFWSMALGSGAVSLLAVTGLAGACTVSHGRLLDETGDDPSADGEIAATAAEPMPGYLPPAREGSILVHLQESAEPEDVNDNPGAVTPSEAEPSDDDGTGQLSAQAR